MSKSGQLAPIDVGLIMLASSIVSLIYGCKFVQFQLNWDCWVSFDSHQWLLLHIVYWHVSSASIYLAAIWNCGLSMPDLNDGFLRNLIDRCSALVSLAYRLPLWVSPVRFRPTFVCPLDLTALWALEQLSLRSVVIIKTEISPLYDRTYCGRSAFTHLGESFTIVHCITSQPAKVFQFCSTVLTFRRTPTVRLQIKREFFHLSNPTFGRGWGDGSTW